MVDNKSRLKAAAAAASAQDTVDMREAQETSNVMWPEGVYRGRVCEVVEFGLQPQEFKGTAKPPAEEIRLGIMLFPNGKVKKQLGDKVEPIILRTLPMAVYQTPKSNTKQIFDRLNVDGQFSHFREMIDEPFRFKLVHGVSKKTGKPYQQLDLKSTLPAVDDDTGNALAVPEVPDNKLVLFTFRSPLEDMWEKLFIDGSRDDGTSKNFVQEKIMAALNFKGSDVDMMLKSKKHDVAVVTPAAIEDDEDEGDDEAPQPKPAPVAKAKPKKAALPEPPTDDEDY